MSVRHEKVTLLIQVKGGEESPSTWNWQQLADLTCPVIVIAAEPEALPAAIALTAGAGHLKHATELLEHLPHRQFAGQEDQDAKGAFLAVSSEVTYGPYETLAAAEKVAAISELETLMARHPTRRPDDIAAAIALADTLGLDDADLDLIVLDAAASDASDVNNDGRDSQIRWLLERYGRDSTLTDLYRAETATA